MIHQFGQRTILFDSDGYRLKGHLHLSGQPDAPLVVGSHGFLSDGNSPKLAALANQCNRCGIGFFRFDHRGCGQSEGVFEAGASVTARRNDILNAIDALKEMGFAKNGLGLFGSSMGGAASLAAAMATQIDAIVTYAAPIQIPSSQPTHEKDTALRFDVDFDFTNIHDILVLHGDADTVVPISHGREIYAQSKRPKQMILQKGGDHPMSNPHHQQAFVREAVYWFRASFERI
ncbi:MAG: alpha/beta hydrolase [Desulfobacterales bacterium]|jgi:alpha-beta hydrolase superfamily lysophospholipase|nr:alpha/beta hydrolase [Desulfobacterales bacterium]